MLDDNKLLTLPNGERLAIPPNVRIMFEVQDLNVSGQALSRIESSQAELGPLDEVLRSVEHIFNVLADNVLKYQPTLRRKKLEHLVSCHTFKYCTNYFPYSFVFFLYQRLSSMCTSVTSRGNYSRME